MGQEVRASSAQIMSDQITSDINNVSNWMGDMNEYNSVTLNLYILVLQLSRVIFTTPSVTGTK